MQNTFFRNNDFSGTYAQIAGNGAIGIPSADGGDLTSLTVQAVVSGVQTVTSATVSTVVGSSDCLFQVQALTTNP